MTKKKVKAVNTGAKQLEPYMFKPGQSGNPAGRPKSSKNFTTMIREALEKVAQGEGTTAETYYDKLVKRILSDMIEKGDSTLTREFWRQHDGAPAQKVELSGGVSTGRRFDKDQMRRVAEEVLKTSKDK